MHIFWVAKVGGYRCSCGYLTEHNQAKAYGHDMEYFLVLEWAAYMPEPVSIPEIDTMLKDSFDQARKEELAKELKWYLAADKLDVHPDNFDNSGRHISDIMGEADTKVRTKGMWRKLWPK